MEEEGEEEEEREEEQSYQQNLRLGKDDEKESRSESEQNYMLPVSPWKRQRRGPSSISSAPAPASAPPVPPGPPDHGQLNKTGEPCVTLSEQSSCELPRRHRHRHITNHYHRQNQHATDHAAPTAPTPASGAPPSNTVAKAVPAPRGLSYPRNGGCTAAAASAASRANSAAGVAVGGGSGISDAQCPDAAGIGAGAGKGKGETSHGYKLISTAAPAPANCSSEAADRCSNKLSCADGVGKTGDAGHTWCGGGAAAFPEARLDKGGYQQPQQQQQQVRGPGRVASVQIDLKALLRHQR